MVLDSDSSEQEVSCEIQWVSLTIILVANEPRPTKVSTPLCQKAP